VEKRRDTANEDGYGDYEGHVNGDDGSGAFAWVSFTICFIMDLLCGECSRLMHRLLLSYGTGMVLCDGVSRMESMGQLAHIWNIGLAVGRSGVCFSAERMRTPWMISPDYGVLLTTSIALYLFLMSFSLMSPYSYGE